ncbi:MAG: hypothetical protein LUD72_14770 [Bacteroidales bacterium]|nr:hypothetical protein [Bacteroidales bacterium]
MSKQRKTSVRIKFSSDERVQIVGQPLGYVRDFFMMTVGGMFAAKAESLRYQ